MQHALYIHNIIDSTEGDPWSRLVCVFTVQQYAGSPNANVESVCTDREIPRTIVRLENASYVFEARGYRDDLPQDFGAPVCEAIDGLRLRSLLLRLLTLLVHTHVWRSEASRRQAGATEAKLEQFSSIVRNDRKAFENPRSVSLRSLKRREMRHLVYEDFFSACFKSPSQVHSRLSSVSTWRLNSSEEIRRFRKIRKLICQLRKLAKVYFRFHRSV